MLKITLLNILMILGIIYIFLFVITEMKESYDLENVRAERQKIGSYYFKDSFPKCNDVSNSYSYGLLVDANIVCNATRNINTNNLYFENLPLNFNTNGSLFVNLDCTDFLNIENVNINIICKTKQTYNILKNIFPHKNIIYTGFTSIDKYNPSIPKNYRKFIHVAGKSAWKGTTPIIQAWEKHPEWPELTLIWRSSPDNNLAEKYHKKITSKNITEINTYLDENQLDYLMNSNSIHICASENEGFGHYLNEGRSVKAVVLYSNAPPMNEFFTTETGIPINTYQLDFINNGICPVYKTTPNDIEVAVEKALKMSIDDLSEMGNQARLDFITNDKQFNTNIKKLFTNNK